MFFSNTFHETHTKPQALVCTNCGKNGHNFRYCTEPVCSYGVLVYRLVGTEKRPWPGDTALCNDTPNGTSLDDIIPEVLMIQRKDSLGFMDIMRGKYKLTDPAYIRKQLHGMTESERQRLLNDDFDKIWSDLWGNDLESAQRYAHDRQTSKQKLTELRSGVDLPRGERYSLAELLRQEPAVYTTPEWGFPKGRRDPFETDAQCAYRELCEETGIREDELLKITNVTPLEENFYGSNDIHYKHTYYIALYVGERDISYDALNKDMIREIGDLQWKPLDEALELLRKENTEKRKILHQLISILKGTIPIFREQLVGENTDEEQQDRYVYRRPAQNSGTVSGGGSQIDGTGKSRKFFGDRASIQRERQTLRRIPNICSGTEATDSQTRRGNGSTRGRRRFISGFGRAEFSEQTSTETGVSGEPPSKDHQ